MSDEASKHVPFALLGTTIENRYRLEEAVGKGATAEVYRASQLVLGRSVALKILKPRNASSATDLVQRFFREATCLARLCHPNIVRVFDAGVYEGLPFLVMEYVEGKPLSSFCRRGPMPPLRAVRIARQIASALTLAHDNHLVHRDLKPSNVLVGFEQDGEVCARLIDFGMVRERENAVELTRTGQLVGTPLYLAPEVIRGQVAGPGADIYALGVTLYQALAGRPPFDTSGGVMAVLHRILADDPAPLAEVVPDARIPPFLEWVVSGCMAREPERRFSSVEHVARALAVCEVALRADASAGWNPNAGPAADSAVALPGAGALDALAGAALENSLLAPDAPNSLRTPISADALEVPEPRLAAATSAD
jgi:serine/threonine-protein kinase